MLRYFDRPDLKILDKLSSQTETLKTHVVTRLTFKFKRPGEGGSQEGYGFVRCNEDFENYYQSVKKTLARESTLTTEFSYQISIQGRINDVAVERDFNDLDSLRQFLEENKLINSVPENTNLLRLG